MSFAATEAATDTNFETFDSFEESEEETQDQDDWSAGEEKEEKEPKPKDEGIKVLKDSEVDSEGKVVKEEGKEPKKEKKDAKEESFDDEAEESEESEDESKEDKVEEDKKDNKKLRIRMSDGELYNIDSNGTLKIKVDGNMEEVPVQELINNYAGKTAWDKKFTEIGKEKKSLEFEKATLTKQKDQLTTHLREALGPIKDINKNPMDSLLYLVEMSGEDPYTAYRRMMESNLDELSSLMDMSETERELFFHKKKDELHSNVAKKRQDKQQKDNDFNQSIQKVDALRQSKNVTEDQFVDASEELEGIYKESGLDVNDITDEAVVDYASMKPHIAVVKELIVPFEENIADGKYGDVVSELSRFLRDGKGSADDVKSILKRNFSVEEEVKELNTKVYQKAQKSSGKKVELGENGSDGSESFDDWEI